jgi:hypothetical protein
MTANHEHSSMMPRSGPQHEQQARQGQQEQQGQQGQQGQQRPQRLQRSELAVPATNPRFFAKAAAGVADVVFLDLEDAVAPHAKDEARANAVAALNDIDWGGKTMAVRVNGLAAAGSDDLRRGRLHRRYAYV